MLHFSDCERCERLLTEHAWLAYIFFFLFIFGIFGLHLMTVQTGERPAEHTEHFRLHNVLLHYFLKAQKATKSFSGCISCINNGISYLQICVDFSTKAVLHSYTYCLMFYVHQRLVLSMSVLWLMICRQALHKVVNVSWRNMNTTFQPFCMVQCLVIQLGFEKHGMSPSPAP